MERLTSNFELKSDHLEVSCGQQQRELLSSFSPPLFSLLSKHTIISIPNSQFKFLTTMRRTAFTKQKKKVK